MIVCILHYIGNAFSVIAFFMVHARAICNAMHLACDLFINGQPSGDSQVDNIEAI